MQHGALLPRPWSGRTTRGRAPVRETIEVFRVAALEDRGYEQVFDVEASSTSSDFMTTPNECNQWHELHFGFSVILDPHVGPAQVPTAVFDYDAKRHLRRIDEPFCPATSPEHVVSSLLGPEQESQPGRLPVFLAARCRYDVGLRRARFPDCQSPGCADPFGCRFGVGVEPISSLFRM